MRLSFLTGAFAATCAVAAPLAIPDDSTKFEIKREFHQLLEARFLPQELDDFHNLIAKRDTELTIASLLDLFNSSGILWSLLDQVAYSPSRIEWLANTTANLIGGFNVSDLSALTSSPLVANLNLNYTGIYDTVMDSGVVSSLLDGVLLDDDYRPVLVNLTSRVMEGNKNLFLYLVQDIFKKKNSKRGLEKRATSTLETFVGNIISSALGSELVGNIATDVVLALNQSQFLTYTVKRFIADEGYQNMTAQLVLDIIRTNKVKLNGNTLNITSLAQKALSKPQVIVGLVSNLLSGQVSIAGLGKYNDALTEIVQDVEDKGVFADLNKYVFSETHTVSTPLLPTGNIVVPRTTRTASATTTAFRNSTTTDELLALGSQQSADEVALILSQLGYSGSTTSSRRSSSSSRRTVSASTAADSSETETNLAQILNELSSFQAASSTPTDTAAETTAQETETITLATSLSSSGGGGILDILASLTNNREVVNRASNSSSSSTSSANGAVAGSTTYNSKILVYVQALLVGGVLLL